ncbi:hypothetical protein [Actinokineospora iranica]|uniref:Uncharacterized protein n=1 Tax=Actinokineospora iranica TaxID=1271860 RepID=A0A1G6IS81_9PSEU|nr:hypothetical protein [Actinokineospora iranica]SDC09301.1 hypothetical protein SAMN05216174_10177 [Actinokineospora iranica]
MGEPDAPAEVADLGDGGGEVATTAPADPVRFLPGSMKRGVSKNSLTA